MVLCYDDVHALKKNDSHLDWPKLRELIIRSQSGEVNAFWLLYDFTYDKVYRSIFYRTLDTQHTEDIVTTVYIKVLKSISKYRGKTDGEFFAWILRIAYTTMIDFLRKTPEVDPVDDNTLRMSYSDDFGKDIDNSDKIHEVLQFLNTLSYRDRTIMTMRIWDDLSYEEIAMITGESVTNAKKIVSRTLEKISANVSYCFFILAFSYYVV